MRVARTTAPGLRKLAELIEAVGPGMLASIDDAGRLSSRPMSPLELDASGALWFFARRGAGCAGNVNLTFVQPDQALYLSVSGEATAVEDRRRIDNLWSSTARIWFPAGPADPDLLLLRVDILVASCWDPTLGRMQQLLPEESLVQEGWLESSRKSSS